MYSFISVLPVVAILAAARTVPASGLRLGLFTSEDNLEPINILYDWNKPEFGADVPSAWESAVTSGRALQAGMKSKDTIARWFFKDHPNFAETVQSPFDGDLRKELKEWGYNDNEELSKQIEGDCDFDANHHIKRAFDELGLDTKASKDGGSNHCYRIDHYNGPKIKREDDGTLPVESKQFYEVCGKQYQVKIGL